MMNRGKPKRRREEDVTANLYESDFYAWTNEQSVLLRAGNLASADITNIAEEIESMGRSEKRELINHLKVLLLHLLKWQFQPALRGRSWRLTIEGQRKELDEHLADNPSLKSKLNDAIISAYGHALIAAEKETELARSTFPPECPYTFAQLVDDTYLPE